MYKKILEQLVKAGTLAFVGYEIGAKVHNDDDKTNNSVHEDKNSEEIVDGIIILSILVIAIIIKLYCKKRRVVWTEKTPKIGKEEVVTLHLKVWKISKKKNANKQYSKPSNAKQKKKHNLFPLKCEKWSEHF